ncbi:hypothetical protein CU103_25650 [Phyllobacterium sophorae]|uniref:Uncharacterized protein n=1 Tax=Phyllobacterium sophorae TaxID=1520277 RepID=A0A2P7B3A6_9HYPH|nr:hypothetical protein CU103_25650 [Phyllobacterium sophorae]
MAKIRILSPTAILGYSFPEASFEEGLRRNPHVIAVDAGSSDPSPILSQSVQYWLRSQTACLRERWSTDMYGAQHHAPLLTLRIVGVA